MDPILANAIAPVFWVCFLHNTIGNAVIGLIEGHFLAKCYGVSRKKAVFVMIGANYLSAAAGVFIGFTPASTNLPIEHARLWIWGTVALAFIITVAIEWPFVRKILGQKKRSLEITLKIHAVSYPIIFFAYWSTSSTGHLTSTDVVSADQFQFPADVDVLYLDSEGVVSRRPLSLNGRPVDIQSTQPPHTELNIFWRREEGWDLVLHSREFNSRAYSEGSIDHTPIALISKIPQSLGPYPLFEGKARHWPELLYRWGHNHNRLGPDSDSGWELDFRWRERGVSLKDKSAERYATVAGLETIWGSLYISSVTRLPNDLVLLQVNKDQICIADPRNQKIALLWRGKDPIPVFREVFDDVIKSN